MYETSHDVPLVLKPNGVDGSRCQASRGVTVPAEPSGSAQHFGLQPLVPSLLEIS